MKPTTFRPLRFLPAILVLVTGLALVSWNIKKSFGRYTPPQTDTTPKTKTGVHEKKVRDLDEALDELNEADLKLDAEKIQRQVEAAMKSLDAAKLKMEIDQSLQKVDLEKVKKELEESFNKIDTKKIQQEMVEAMKEVNAAKIQQEAQLAMAGVDMEKMKVELKKEMDELKSVDLQQVEETLEKAKAEMRDMGPQLQKEMEKTKAEMRDMGPQLQKEMEKAKTELEKAKTEMKEYKEFVDGLDADGLINKKEAYTIRHKDGELTVNGKKVSSEVYSKYRSFLEKHKTFNINKSPDDFNIDNGDHQ